MMLEDVTKMCSLFYFAESHIFIRVHFERSYSIKKNTVHLTLWKVIELSSDIICI